MKKVSGGYYKNAGQDIILWCDKSEKEVIEKLGKKTIDDTLVYDFFEKNNIYYFNVLGICRFQKTLFPTHFILRFLEKEEGTYIIASLANRAEIVYSSAFEIELYDFFAKKLGCIPQNRVS